MKGEDYISKESILKSQALCNAIFQLILEQELDPIQSLIGLAKIMVVIFDFMEVC